jgi:hypothetical protein
LARAKSTASPVVEKIVGSEKDIHQKIVAGYLPAKVENPEKFRS